jgi:hypothetical protein
MQTTPLYLKYIPLFIVITIPSIVFGDSVKPGTVGGPSMSQEWMRSIFSSYHKPIVNNQNQIYFHDNYAHAAISTPPSIASPSAQTSPIMSSAQKSFTTQYRRKEKASINKLEKYLKLPAEDFDTCNLIQW